MLNRKKSIGTIFLCSLILLTACGNTDNHSAADDQSTTAISDQSTTDYSQYVTLGNYKGLEVTKVATEVTDEDIEEQIDNVLSENLILTPIKDGAAELGHQVTIDYDAKLDGEDFENGSARNLTVILGEYELPSQDLDLGIVGMKPSESKDIEVTFPAADPDEEDPALIELSNKTIIFNVTLHEIFDMQSPTYDDEFVASISDFKTTDEYETDMKEKLFQQIEHENNIATHFDLFQLVIADSKINGYPPELYDKCKAEQEEMAALYVSFLGGDIADYLGDEEELINLVNTQMIIGMVAKTEKIEVSDSEYETYILETYEEMGYDSAEEYKSLEAKDVVIETILQEKVGDFLLANAKVTEISAAEYMEQYEDYEEFDFEDVDGEEGIEYELD